MTRYLKLVRHEDGKWKALPTETDDTAQVSLKERQYAPIDPDQLLKALDSLLSKTGGIKSVEDVPRLASIMNGLLKLLQCVWSCLMVSIAFTINISDFFSAIEVFIFPLFFSNISMLRKIQTL